MTFDAIVTAEDMGLYKSTPCNFKVRLTRGGELGMPEGRLLHVAQSLFHDHVPARRVGLPSVWINRRHDRPGWGATPEPQVSATPDSEFPSKVSNADAVNAELLHR